MLAEHKVITIAEYRLKAAEYEKRYCTSHDDEEYGLCCSVCYQVYCVKCIHPLEYCPKTGMIAGRVCHHNVGPTDGKIIQTLSDFSHGEFV